MVRAIDLSPSFSDNTLVDEDLDAPFGGLDLALLAAAHAGWADDTPPDTPRMGSPQHMFASDLLVDSMLKCVERDWDALQADAYALSPNSSHQSSKSGSPCSVMWASVDPACKLFAASAPAHHSTTTNPCDSPAPFDFDLFPLESGVASEDEGFNKEAVSGCKRKCSSMESMESKKIKARQMRDALTEPHLRLVTADTPDAKRITHNVLERKRRNDLKASYHDLRETIPELVSQDRAPTAQILQKAVEYIETLKSTEGDLLANLAALRAENERLQRNLSMRS